MKHDLLLSVGDSVRGFRLRLGISQEVLAERADLHRTYVGAIERGEQNVSILNIGRLADALGVSIDTLLDFSGSLIADADQVDRARDEIKSQLEGPAPQPLDVHAGRTWSTEPTSGRHVLGLEQELAGNSRKG